MNIPAEAIELGHHNRAFATPRLRKGCGELRLAIESISALPIFDPLDPSRRRTMTDAGPGTGDAPTGLPAERLRPSNFARWINGDVLISFQISRAVDQQIIPCHNRLWDTVLRR
jgi:hypothetical protein